MENDLKTCNLVSVLNGVGDRRKMLLERISIRTIGDLLLHIPIRFLDRRFFTSVSDLQIGTDAVVVGTIIRVTKKRRGTKGPALTAVLADETGSVTLTFFSAGFPGSKLYDGLKIVACGSVESFKGYVIVHPELYFTDQDASAVKSPGMLPIYGLTAGLTQGFLRKLVSSAIPLVKNSLEDILPVHILESAGFETRFDVFKAAHTPDTPEEAKVARDLLALEELYLYKSLLVAIRERSNKEPGIPLKSLSLDKFQSTLPWPLTSAQLKVCDDVRMNLLGSSAMRRLIQGDVGSGKTVVAVFAAIVTALAGKTAVVLAPTAVLSAQHYASFLKLTGFFNVKVHLLTGGTSASGRSVIGQELREKPDSILIGTHAVLEDWVPLDKLALLIIDEQHRFGVSQREKLLSSQNPRPHVLVMSATPIPRTLAMTFYGDLDISVIDEMPPGRGSVETQIVQRSKRASVFEFIISRLQKKERVFLVYPLKEISEQSDLLDATTAYETVKNGPLAKFGTGLLHGSMPSAEKVDITNKFSRGEISVLVSTTVIEVGIDVPEATIMVISNAERFGLSQLHQLRGRVGRGGRKSWCFLVPGSGVSRAALERMNFLVSNANGFIIAEKDLQIRGPGQVLGTMQHGIPKFKVADLTIDSALLKKVNAMTPIELDELKIIMKNQKWRFPDMEFPM